MLEWKAVAWLSTGSITKSSENVRFQFIRAVGGAKAAQILPRQLAPFERAVESAAGFCSPSNMTANPDLEP